MSDDEDCEDLPEISVNTSAGDSSTFAMPSAEEVASQRARELHCEEELLRLRERDQADTRGAALAALVHSDSSGSEGDAQLAAAVTALSVRPPAAGPPRAGPPAAGPPAPGAAALWAALAPHLPPPAEALASHLCGPAHLDCIVASVVASMTSEAGELADEEILSMCALLCVAMLAHESRSKRAAARAMHQLLDQYATAAQESELAILLLASFRSGRIRVQLSDLLRSGAGAGADRVSGALTRVAMLQLLAGGAAPASGAEWRALVRRATAERVAAAAAAWRQAPPAAAYSAVQLAGRALAAAEAAPPARAALLAQLAPPAAAGHKLAPDQLKVLVSASKLQLLFRTE